MAACGGGAASTDAPKDADSAKKDDTSSGSGSTKSSDDPVAQLQDISDGVQKQVDVVLQPIKDSDAVLDSVASLPKDLKTTLKSKVDPKKVMAEAKKILAGKAADLDALKLEDEAKAKVQERFDKLKVLYDSVTNLDTALKDLGTKISDASTQIPQVGGKAITKIKVTLKNPVLSGDAKKKAEDDQAKIQGIMDGFKDKVTAWQKDMTDIPTKAKALPAKWAKLAK
jgi:hypothetical protein